MNNRVEIKVAVLGDISAGKDTFSQMLFLNDNHKIRVDQLSKLACLYMETDPENFPVNTKKVIDDCHRQNALIMQQTEIKCVENLRNNKINPYFYRYINRICGLIDYETDNRINKNILLNFYLIGNNYLDFCEEINSANIYIFISDIDKCDLGDNQCYQYLIDLIKINKKKYLMTVINKCDTLSSNAEFEPGSTYYQKMREIDKIVRLYAEQAAAHQNILPPIPISCKYATLFRKVLHTNFNDISMGDKIFISNMFDVKKGNICRDIRRNRQKYLQQSGFAVFRDMLADILNSKYKSMIDDNFDFELANMSLTHSTFSEDIINIKNKADRLSKIFKKNTYHQTITTILKDILDNDNLTHNPDNPVKIQDLDFIKDIYGSDTELVKKIDSVKEIICLNIIDNIKNKIYDTELSNNTFLPSKIYHIFNELNENMISLNSTNIGTQCVKQLATYICDLYSTRARELLLTDIDLLFTAFFTDNEALQLVILIREMQQIVKFEIYQQYLVQIWITKLMVANKYINYWADQSNINTISSYCRSLRYLLTTAKCNKYEYLLTNISDVCTQISMKNDIEQQLEQLATNINNTVCNNLIELDIFIIKRLRKTDYQSAITENVGSDMDSDDNYSGDDGDDGDSSCNDSNSDSDDGEYLSETKRSTIVPVEI